MRTSFFLILFVGIFSVSSFSQGMSDMIIRGGDWRICGTYLEKDTMEFKCMDSKIALFDCGDRYTSQIIFSPGKYFRFILWDKELILLDISGNFEVNDSNGEIRFYFED